MTKRIILIVAIVAATILLVAGGFFLYNALTSAPQSTNSNNENGGDFFSRIFSSDTSDTPFETQNRDPGAQTDSADVSRLMQLTKSRVAGFGMRGGSQTYFVRYLERETGNVVEIPLSGGPSRHISNTTIPRTQEAYFSATSSSAFARLIRENVIETLYLPLGTTTLPSLFLEPNIVAFATSPNEEKIFYLLKTPDGALGYVANVNGSRPRQVFSSPLQQLTANWNAPNQITVTNKASQGYEGISYSVSPTTGASRKLIGALPGLLVKGSADATYTLYSTFADGAGRMFVRDEKTGESRLVPFITLPEKCAWSRNSPVFYCAVPYRSDEGVYPDDWYMGRARTADNLWAVDVKNNVAVLLYDLSQRNYPPLDVARIEVSPDNLHLVFLEKDEETLWSFQIIPREQLQGQ